MGKLLYRVHSAFLHPALRRLLLLSAVLLLILRFHPAAEVTVNGEEIGKYTPFAVHQSLKAANAAAYEITGRTVDLQHGVKLRLCLTSEPYCWDTRRLERALLTSVPGVKRLWVASAGDRVLGVIEDPSVLGELQQVLVDSYVGPRTLEVYIEPEITLRRSFAREDDVLSQTEISKRLREALTVHTTEMQSCTY